MKIVFVNADRRVLKDKDCPHFLWTILISDSRVGNAKKTGPLMHLFHTYFVTLQRLFTLWTINPREDRQLIKVKVDDEVGAFYYAESVFRIASARIGNPSPAELRRKKTSAKMQTILFFFDAICPHFTRISSFMRTILGPAPLLMLMLRILLSQL